MTVALAAEQSERADRCGFGRRVALGVEDGEGVGEPGPHCGRGRLLGLVQLGEQRIGESEGAEIGVVGADNDDLGVGCGSSQVPQDGCQPGPVGGDRRRCGGLEAGEVTGWAGQQEVISVVAVERQRDGADFAAVGGQERQRRIELGAWEVVVQRMPGCLPDAWQQESGG